MRWERRGPLGRGEDMRRGRGAEERGERGGAGHGEIKRMDI